MPHPPGAAVVLAAVACCLGSTHAGVSAYWALGGTALADTVGGSIGPWAEDGRATARAVLWLAVVVKLVIASVGFVAVAAEDHPRIRRAPGVGQRRRRVVLPHRSPLGWARTVAGFAAVLLVLYGGVLTAVGLAVEAGVLDAAAGADRHAMAWPTYLWDAWFLVWGLCLGTALWLSRARVRRLH